MTDRVPKLDTDATQSDGVNAFNALADAVNEHTRAEGEVIAQAMRKEIDRHVDEHHTPVIDILYGKPKRVVGDDVVEREEGLADKVEDLVAQSRNGGVRSKLTATQWVALVSTFLAAPWLTELVKGLFGG